MIQSVLSKISLQLFTSKIRQILQVRTEIRTNIFRRLYVDACELYPENTLSENSDIASTVTQAVLGLDSFNLTVDDSCVKLFVNELQMMNGLAKISQIITGLLHTTFLTIVSYSLHTEHIEEAMCQAREAIASVEA